MTRLGNRGAILVAALVSAWSESPVAAQENLPPGPAVPLILDACVQCHDLRAVVSQRKTETAWRRTVDEMIWRGAPLIPGEADVIARYLSSTFGTQQSAPTVQSHQPNNDPLAKYLPPGPGRGLVIAACVSCHDLATTITQRMTPQAWRRSVEQMARLGARLNGSEIRVVATYLARSFGPDNPVPKEIRNR